MTRPATLLVFALGFAAGSFSPFAGGGRAPAQEPEPTPKPREPEDPFALPRRDALQRKIEKDLEGVWELASLVAPTHPALFEPKGFFLFYQGHLAYTMTARESDRFGKFSFGLFQSGVKRFTVTEQGSLLLSTLLGVTNTRGELELEASEADERAILFEDEHTVRISRFADDYVLLRRTPTESPRPRPPFPPRRDSKKSSGGGD